MEFHFQNGILVNNTIRMTFRQYIFYESISVVYATSYELPVIAMLYETGSEYAVFIPMSIFYEDINYIANFKQ